MTYTQSNLPPAHCNEATWIVRDSQKRAREVARKGYSPLPLFAVCSKCGHVIKLQPDPPSEEYIQRKLNKKRRMYNTFKDDDDPMINI